MVDQNRNRLSGHNNKAASSPTASGLHRLIYTSEGKAPGETEITSLGDVEIIAASAARRNADAGLSGVLIAVRSHFIQVLEGEPASLEQTFERICRDMRHRNISLIDFSPINARRFENWDMAAIDSDHFPDSERLEDLYRGIIGGMAPDAIIREVEDTLLELAKLNRQAS